MSSERLMRNPGQRGRAWLGAAEQAPGVPVDPGPAGRPCPWAALGCPGLRRWAMADRGRVLDDLHGVGSGLARDNAVSLRPAGVALS